MCLNGQRGPIKIFWTSLSITKRAITQTHPRIGNSLEFAVFAVSNVLMLHRLDTAKWAHLILSD